MFTEPEWEHNKEEHDKSKTKTFDRTSKLLRKTKIKSKLNISRGKPKHDKRNQLQKSETAEPGKYVKISTQNNNDVVNNKVVKSQHKETCQKLKTEKLNGNSSTIQKGKSKIKKHKLETVINRFTSNNSLRHDINVNDNSSKLRARMMEKLKAAQFRFLNEKLYLSESNEAHTLFKSDPEAFKVYHDGFQQQIRKWPVNPLNIIIKELQKMPKSAKVADLGCGEGALAKQVSQNVRSFDLVSTKPHVEECDMAHTPLHSGEIDILVYCLALMGTNLKAYLVEANRVLKVGGIMKIAEVESRFEDVNAFVKDVEKFGFQVTKINDKHNLFFFLDFKKIRDLGKNRGKLPKPVLKPCLYKKR